VQVEAVVYDIGNVLIEWNPERFYDARYGEARRRALFDGVDLHAMNDRIDRGEEWERIVRETALANPDFADEIADWHASWIEMASPVIPHSLALLRGLRSKGVPVHALTNFGRETFAFAEVEYEFLQEFDLRFVSGHLGVVKPDPAIYAKVEEETGLAPETLLFTDDRPENVAAAAERGWGTHLFEGPAGWAARLVREGLLSEAEAAER
jgi:2-haloacid dehalogenase